MKKKENARLFCALGKRIIFGRKRIKIKGPYSSFTIVKIFFTFFVAFRVCVQLHGVSRERVCVRVVECVCVCAAGGVKVSKGNQVVG